MSQRKTKHRKQFAPSDIWLPLGAFTLAAAAIVILFQVVDPGKVPPVESTATAWALAAARVGCTAVNQPAGETQDSLFPPVGEDEWQVGPSNAGVTIIDYCDFQSDGCAGFAASLTTLNQEFPNDLRIVYRHYPLVSVNDKAALAVQAAEAAGQQDMFWQMHDVLYSFDWGKQSPDEFKEWVANAAGELGMDTDVFIEAMESEALAALAQEAWVSGVSTGIPQTPFVLINGEYYDGPRDATSLAAIIRLLLLRERQFNQCPPQMIEPGKQYVVTLHTEKGDILIELFTDKAPFAANSFVFLVENGWYDGVSFHRVISGYLAQAGDPSGTGMGGPGYNYEVELSSLTFNRAGLVAMANAGPGTNGSQFFITFGPAAQLNGRFTIFGEVISGMDIVAALTHRDPSTSNNLPMGDMILNATVDMIDYDN